MKEAKAFSPCHITGFFQILDQPSDSIHVGSRGAGVSLSRGVRTKVQIRKGVNPSTLIIINNSAANSAEVSRHVLDTFLTRLGETGDFKIVAEHQIPLPIGAGFGTSGAAALSLAIALDEVFGLGMSEIEAAQLAHMAEVECKTGLGTVIAEFFGGLEIRVKPGAPGIGEIEQVPVPGDHKVVCLSFNSLSTREFLSDEKTRRYINELGGNLVDKFIESPDVRNFMRFSRQFAEQIGLITAKVREVLDAVDQAGFACSMPMFGESVFALIENGSLPEILKIFRRCNNGGRIFVSGIDFEGARLLK